MPKIQCANGDCADRGVPKDVSDSVLEGMPDDVPVSCGTCGQPIDTTQLGRKV